MNNSNPRISGRTSERKKNMNHDIDSLSGTSTASSNQMYAKIHTENYKFYKDIQSNVGSPNTQHGEAAEKIEVRNRNVKHIKNNESASARSETNRIHTTTDIYDNNEAYQMKYCKTAEATLDSLIDSKHDYRGVKKIVDPDLYDDVIKLADKRIELYEKKAQACKSKGDTEGYKKYKDKIDRCKDVKQTTEPGLTSRPLSEFAAKHPKLTSAAFVIKDANSAGVQGGLTGAAVTSVLQGANNILDFIDNKIELSEAIINTAKAATNAAVKGYAYGVTGSLISSGIGVAAEKITDEALKTTIKNFAGSSGPTYILVASIEFSKCIANYCKGNLSKQELLEQVGETSIGLAGSYIGGMVGSIGGSIGQIIGSTLGYIVTTSLFRGITEARKMKELAAYYNQIGPLLEKAKEELVQARKEFENICFSLRLERFNLLKESFDGIENAILNSNTDVFLSSLNTIFTVYGEGLRYHSFDEFDKDMLDDSMPITI